MSTSTKFEVFFTKLPSLLDGSEPSMRDPTTVDFLMTWHNGGQTSPILGLLKIRNINKRVDCTHHTTSC
jgi:hypothetical protein